MGAGPRTPLRALIARESSDGSFQTLSQPTDDPTPRLTKSSLWARTRREEAGSARKSAASSRRRSGSCKVKGGNTTPPSGCSSPITRLGHAPHKMGAVAIPPTPNCMAKLLRPVQLGALFAQDRENQTCTSRTLADHGGQPPLRDLIVAELASTCRASGVGFLPPVAVGSRSPSPGNLSSEGNHADCRQPLDMESSQELWYMFPKDWALQTSDEDDEFWDSGSLCGLASPSPRWSGHDQHRRRTKKWNSKLRHSSSSSHCTPAVRPTSKVGTQHSLRGSPPFPTPTPTPTTIASLQELHAHSPGHGRFIPKDAPCGQGPKSSLGSLLAEEISASSLEATWSVPSQSSRRPKIGSLSDISAPVRRESQSQLDFLIAKILTLRANSMEAKSSNATSATFAEEAADDGGCSTSGSNIQGSAADTVRVAEDEALVCPATDFSSSSSSAVAAGFQASSADENLSMVDAPIVMNPPIPDVEEAPDSSHSTRHEPHSSVMTSTVGETIDSLSAVTDAGKTALRHEGDHGYDEAAKDAARSNSEVEVPAPERVQLGALLEQTRGEHGWIPLGRSRTGSPFSLVGSQQLQQPLASSSTSARFNKVSTKVVSTNDTCHHSSPKEPMVSLRSSQGSPRSPELGAFQQATDPPPESTTGTERVFSTTMAAVATASPVVDAAAATAGSAMREQQRPPMQRVSLLSLLNQDMEMDLEDGLHLMLCGGGCRLDEEPEEPANTEELDPLCCVCTVGHKGAAFIPCGHTFCRRCCREVHRSIGSCPLCNQAIVDVLKLY